MGLHTLVRLSEQAADIGAQFRLGEVSTAVRRVVDLTGMEGLLTDSRDGSG
ncbi:anti-anti-sigma regulatory factor [Catenulispora sp. MAP5-51]|uniref:hypothetical protein n=1 Tax=Catenulispora sp. MAP5-51 TaxID=3156298 RepID=UPI0035174568